MAIFSKIVIAASAFAALTAARPLAIRDVTSMVTETAYTTVNVPVTLWVDENGKPLSTVVEGGNFAAQPTPAAETPKVIESSASPSSPQAQAQVVPTTTPAPQAQAVPTTASAPQAPAYTPASSPSPSTSNPAPAPTNNAQSGQSSGEVIASSSGTCEGTGSACEGDITHWDGGLGACGWNVNTESDMQIALPAGFMGTQSNGNPYCGRSLTIKNPTTGQTAQATVGDKCMGCVGRSIDLTNTLFAAIGGGCDGRCSGFQWWFN